MMDTYQSLDRLLNIKVEVSTVSFMRAISKEELTLFPPKKKAFKLYCLDLFEAILGKFNFGKINVMNTKQLLFLVLFITIKSLSAQVNDFEYIIEKQKKYSNHLNEEHNFNVYLPIGYYESTDKYPVLYIIESVYHFTKALNAVHGLSKLSPQIPEMIIVGLNTSDRWRDLTPSHTENWMGYPIPQSGNGKNYLSFIEKEIVPLIDTSYRTQPFRVVFGHSLGGLFSLYSLAESPDLFNGFIASSPNLEYDGRIVNNETKELSQQTLGSHKYIYLCGDNDSDDYTEESKIYTSIIDSLTTKIEYLYHYYDDENHWEVPDQSIIDGLKYIFKDFTLPDSIISLGAKKVKAFYENTSSKYGYEVKPIVGYINHLGYIQLNEGNTEEAIDFFSYNVSLYPDDANVYDSLGEGFLKQGKTTEAIENYKKSLQLNPNNDNARRVLEEIDPEK